MKVDGKAMRSIWIEPDGWSVGIIDQTALPHRLVMARLTTLDEAAHAIRAMLIRGAPLIGATAAYGICLALRADASDEALDRAYAVLLATRPTAINLKWALDEMMAAVRNRPRAERSAAAYRRAAEICEEDVAINTAIGRNGLPLIEAIAARKKRGERVNVLTHCNAGWLAAVDVGTATAPIYLAHDKGLPVHVFADETRPRNQGASLTAWELGQHGVPHTVIADNTGGHLMQHGLVDLVIVGTDRVTRQRRRLQQDRDLPEGARRARQQRPVLCGAALADDRFHDCRRPRRDSHRGAQRRRGGDNDRAHRRRPHRDGTDRARRFCRGELRLRRDAGAAGDRPDHRTRRRRGLACGLGRGFSGARRKTDDGRQMTEDGLVAIICPPTSVVCHLVSQSESVACVSSPIALQPICHFPEFWP